MAEDVAIEGRVAQVLDERRIIINVGDRDGVRIGMRFIILANTPLTIRDPETDEVLDEFERNKGRVEVIEVRPRVSTCSTKISPTISFPIFGIGSQEAEDVTLPVRESDFPSLPAEERFVKVGDRVREIGKTPRNPVAGPKVIARDASHRGKATDQELSQLASVHAVLAQRGVEPGFNGYDDATLIRAIADEGLTYEAHEEDGTWTVELQRRLAPTVTELYVARGYWDRASALAFALRMALLD